ncbi:molybdopterin-binding protein [Aeromonas schubertii]|uniref:Molybdopterin-binding protein n=1 Tax=Aeromonas schubertii TaxID=652 RepID=A0ABS7V8X0_9GAMM|nr:molybdopterin-binding protein [Aeromonas schubertii]MBZ6065822.1 molybdopterin-binding protein [Aeromonas schubertii]
MKVLTLCLTLLLSVPAIALDAPAGKPLLTIEGKITQTNMGDKALLDASMLDALPSADIVTQTPWYDKARAFNGPTLKSLLALVGAKGTSLKITALNDYSVVIPIEDADLYGVILARTIDGKPLKIRDKGPLFMMYPYDQVPKLRSKLYYDRAIWQIARIEVE